MWRTLFIYIYISHITRDVIVQYIILPVRINAEKSRTDQNGTSGKTRGNILCRHLSACCNEYTLYI